MIHLIKVRDANDINLVAQLADEIWNSHYLPIIGQQQINYMLQHIQSQVAISKQIESENYQYFIVQQAQQSVGYFAQVPNIQSASVLVSKLYVKKELQGHGIGAEIMTFIETSARELKMQSLWLTVNRDNKNAIRFYTRRGFQIKDSLIQDIGNGFIMDDYKMVKHIYY